MTFRLGDRSNKTLVTVDPRLQAVVQRAIGISTVDFVVGQGLRYREDQYRLYGQGRTPAQLAAVNVPIEYSNMRLKKVTWTMKSNHLTGRAVDLWVWKGGAISWDTADGSYGKIAVAMKRAAMELCTVIVWGGDWAVTKDFPHFELA